MGYLDLVDDTICAPITAPGRSGIAVIRVCGDKALSATKKIAPYLPKAVESHRVYFGHIKGADGQVVDEALITYFEKGRSFTGDETTEISCHGGLFNANQVLRLLNELGVRTAEPGEFSFRAFYNGKIDLVQAEAIRSLIDSRNEVSRNQSIQQLTGLLSNHYQLLEDQLTQLLAQLEASIDFSTEDITPYSDEKLQSSVYNMVEQVQALLDSYKKGQLVSEGLKVGIVGPANAGKSSLYNFLVQKDQAIVTDIEGTTRDTLTSTLYEFGQPLTVTDTAGLRDSTDKVESLGIEKSLSIIENSDVLLYVIDINDLEKLNDQLVIQNSHKTYLVLNKLDTLNPTTQVDTLVDSLSSQMTIQKDRILTVSLKKSLNLQLVKNLLNEESLLDIESSETLVTQHRHSQSLSNVLKYLLEAKEILETTKDLDIVATLAQESLMEVFSLLGKEYDDEVMDRVFKEFCLGK